MRQEHSPENKGGHEHKRLRKSCFRRAISKPNSSRLILFIAFHFSVLCTLITMPTTTEGRQMQLRPMHRVGWIVTELLPGIEIQAGPT
jgi:hypothetical protein